MRLKRRAARVPIAGQSIHDSCHHWLLWVVCLSLTLIPGVAIAQGGNLGGFGTLGGVEPTGQYPAQQYYLGLQAYRDGDLETAITLFEDSLRRSRKDINGRWIDSIPSLAMLGECYWHLGDLATVRQHVDHAMQIAARNRGWLGRIEWDSAIQPSVQAVRQGLWPEATAVKRISVSDRIMYRSGTQLTGARVAAGGVIEEPNLRTMDVVEMMRGLAIAAYRRRVLLGPLAEQNSLSVALLQSTKYPANLNVPIARSLIGSLRTSGYFSNHEDQRAIDTGAGSSMLGGSAHPLTAVAILSQISAVAGSDKPALAVPTALNLVHVAASLDQPEFIGEAMQLAAGCADPPQAVMVRQMASKIATALFRKSRLASLHSLIAGADASITAGDLDSASNLISQAQALSSRRDVLQPRLQAYGAYVAARLAAAKGSSFGINEATELDQTLSQMSVFALNHRSKRRSLISMPRIYQLGLIRQAIGTSSIGGITGDKLLKEYCQDPPAEVWHRDAVDALACSMYDRSLAHMTRINMAIAQDYGEHMLQTVDLMLAARFNQRLPLGGRVAQVRSLARASDDLLDKPVLEFRNRAGNGMKQLRAAIQAAGADPNKLAALESQACAIALSRLHLPQTSPPLLDEKLPVGKLSERTGLMTFTAVGNQFHATFAVDGKITKWSIPGGSRLTGEIGRLLRGIGVGKGRGNRLPEDDSWKETALNLRRQLFPDSATLTSDRIDELIVVPDGSLWYLPFDLLPLSESEPTMLGDRITVRYAATPGLAIKPVSGLPLSRTVGLSTGLFFAPRDPELNQSVVQSVLDVLNDPVRIPDAVDTPTGLLGNKLGHLVVAAPRVTHAKNHLATGLSPHDDNSPFGTLAAWMRFPAETPRSVILVGYRTPVDMGQMGNGDELFATLCALQGAGVRSVMISRWAVGGESTAILLREFLQELPFTGMNQSWNRAKRVLGRSELDPAAEPLLSKADQERDNLTGREPLFWSGYLVCSPPHPEVPAKAP